MNKSLLLIVLVLVTVLAVSFSAKNSDKIRPLKAHIGVKRGNKTPQGSIARVKLNDFKLIQYYLQISIGNPAQFFEVDISTHTGNLWVPSSVCSYDGPLQNLYNSSPSSTYRENGEEFSIESERGLVKGRRSYDDVTIGGIIVKNQIFGEADLLVGSQITTSDGSIGLGRSGSKRKTFIDNMIDQGLIPEALFSVYFTSDSNVTKEAGELILGGIDHDKYHGELVYSNLVDEKESWRIRVENVALDFGNTQSNYQAKDMMNATEVGPEKIVYCKDGCDTVVDTGASFIVIPKIEGVPLLEKLGAIKKEGSSEYLAPNCDDLSALPDLVFTISGGEFRLKPEHYVVRTEGSCYIGIMTAPGLFGMLNPPWLLGSSFLRQFYTVFDQGNKRVGFAPVRR